MRIQISNPLLPEIDRGKPIQITVDGQPLDAYEGETIAAVLLAAGIWAFRRTSKQKLPRGVFCGMGVCYDCLVQVDGGPSVRACVTPVVAGMRLETGQEDAC